MVLDLARRTFLAGSASIAAGTVCSPFALATSTQAPITGRKLRIALSNSFIGNKWRIMMENVYKAALQMEPYMSEVTGTWFNSGNDVAAQSQQLSNLISQRFDAILIDAASPTGLNGILRQATARGILVVSFDNVVTAPSVLKVHLDEYGFGVTWAEWLAKKLNGKGNVIMVTGVAGTYDNDQRNAGAQSVWKKYPDIKIVNQYTGMWDSSVAERNTAAILPSLPKIDGIWCQGGTDGVLKAFINAGRIPLPPTAGTAENGFRKFMIGYMGQKVEGISIDDPPYESVVALALARSVLRGTYPRRDITLPSPIVTTETVKVGETVFPDQPDSLVAVFTDSGPNAVVKFCVDAALQGTPCGGRLDVRLPTA
ncbi:MAG TPA: sugar ABC transporter substrate-binding protein [Acetobacteraceae bacterium]|nr:sugar ABC transporter substrate-binding protein [Acetobacteraceae bacterium]